MAGFKDNALERRNASIAAKQALLEKFKSQPTLDDPTLQQRLAERRAIAEARAERMAERKRLQEIEKQRQAEIKAAEEAARRAAEEEQQRLLAEQALMEERKREERKAARDARYAARKQRVMRKIR
jgi:hypothetical protein